MLTTAGSGQTSMRNQLSSRPRSILQKGGFFIKKWECSGEDGAEKYLGMTWDSFSDRNSLKFRLNLHKKFSREDLDSTFLEDPDIPVTKKNVLSVACQFYDPAGLASPIMFPIRDLFSDICRDSKCSVISAFDPDRATRFRAAVGEILKTKSLNFPRQIFFKILVNSSYFLTEAFRGTEPASMFSPSTMSISLQAPPRSWGNLPCQLLNQKSPVPCWLSGWS